MKALFTNMQVAQFIQQFAKRADRKARDILVYAGEYAVKKAREDGVYNDITGNLRSSIGYVVALDGVVVESDFQIAGKGTDGQDGVREARQLAYGIAKTFKNGYCLVVVAGMQYAAAVEAMDNKDVLTATEQHTSDYLNELIEDIL